MSSVQPQHQSSIKKYKPKEAILSSSLIKEGQIDKNKKLGISEIVTKARNENLRIIHKKEVEPLKEICLRKVSENYILFYKEINRLDQKSREILYDMMDISDNIQVSFESISYEKYWQRACYVKYKAIDVYNHGNSWKQCFAENYLKEVILNFNKDRGDILLKQASLLMKDYIFNLELNYLSSDIDFQFLIDTFHNLTSLQIKYSPYLLEKTNCNESLLKTIQPIKDEYSRFGMRINSIKYLSIRLKDMNYLLDLNLQGNFLDDEIIKWLVPGLISNQSISYLNLSNNLLDSASVIKLSSLLIRSKNLITIDLSNNQITGEGGFALSIVIKENTQLKSIRIGMNMIDDVNISRILKAIENNSVLEVLDLSSNKISQVSSQAFEKSIGKNRTILSIDVSNSQFELSKSAEKYVEEHPFLVKFEMENCLIDDLRKDEIIKKLIKKEVRLKRAGELRKVLY